MKKLIKIVLFAIIRLFTIKNDKYIIFESADFFYDNSYALFLYVKQNYPQYKLKYIVTNKEQEKTAFINGISKKELLKAYNNHLFSFQLFKYSLKSKCLFYSLINYWRDLKTRNSTKVVYLGHGEFPLKNIEHYLHILFANSYSDNYICVQTVWSEETQKAKYPILNNVSFAICGAPRNDFMFSNQFTKNQLFDLLGIKDHNGNSVIFCLCTFRKMYDASVSLFDDFPINISSNQLVELNDQLIANNQTLLIKIHHAQRKCFVPDNLSNILFIDNVFLQEKAIQLHSIYPLVDAMITDYSTAYISYLDINRPIGFIIADKEKYEKEKGFTVDNIEDLMPGPKILSFNELISFLNSVKNKKDDYKNDRAVVKEKLLGDFKDKNCYSVAHMFLDN